MPAFPQKFNSTVSHWQQTNRGPTSLWNHGRYDKLPTEVIDYVIIGAGATGASLAYHLSRPGGAAEGKSIVVVDAKDVASCASGRNGGHVPAQTWHMFAPFMAPVEQGGGGLTMEEVVEILMFEQDNLDLVESIVKKEGIDADFKRADRFEVLTTPESAAENGRLYRQFLSVLDKHPRLKGRKFQVEIINDPKEAKRISRVEKALAVNRCVAGSWHPHRGVTALMRLALESKVSNVKLFSWAPVSGFTELPDGTIAVDCGERGVLRTHKLIIGTSAYSHHLLPELKEVLTGYRLQAGLVVPPSTFAGAQALKGTYAIEDGSYLIQTPTSGLVFGPYGGVAQKEGVAKASEMYGCEDDSVTTAPWRDWLNNYCAKTFSGWGPEIPGEGLTKVWSGIICHSFDQTPLVGALPGRKNVYMSAGYSGQGMALIVNITRGLANQLKTGEWDDTVPRCFELSQERLNRIKSALNPKDYPENGLSFQIPRSARL